MLTTELLPVSMWHRIFQGFFDNGMPLLIRGMFVTYSLAETLSTAISRSPLGVIHAGRELMAGTIKNDA